MYMLHVATAALNKLHDIVISSSCYPTNKVKVNPNIRKYTCTRHTTHIHTHTHTVTDLELLPQFDVDYLGGGPLVVPGTHLVNVGGCTCVCDAEDLSSQSANESHRPVHRSIARDGDGSGLVHRLPVMDLREREGGGSGEREGNG
jgi:hypothetical protein